MVHQDGLGNLKGGGAEVAVQFHKTQISKFNHQGRKGVWLAWWGEREDFPHVGRLREEHIRKIILAGGCCLAFGGLRVCRGGDRLERGEADMAFAMADENVLRFFVLISCFVYV
jgi:hypothetical protein